MYDDCSELWVRSADMILVVLLLLHFAPLAANGETDWTVDQVCGSGASSGNYTTNRTYHANLELLSTRLSTKVSPSPFLFAKDSVGATPDITYGLALCRGDVNSSTCHACVAAAFQDALELCALDKNATIFHNFCHLHFSDKDFLSPSSDGGVVADTPMFLFDMPNILPGWNASIPAIVTTISGRIMALFQDTAHQAAYNSTRRYATGRMDVNSTATTLYSLAQCTPDLTPTDCSECFQIISKLMTMHFAGQDGGRFLSLRCNFRYEVYQFYLGEPKQRIGSPPAVAVPPAMIDDHEPRPSQPQKRHPSKTLVIALLVPLIVSSLAVMIFLGLRRHRREKGPQEAARTKQGNGEQIVWELEGRSSDCKVYDFSQVLDATNNFSDENKLGQGGFGPVYKGRFPDGLEIAVKRLSSHSGQGYIEFKNEIQLIARLQHTNLVRLLGCCTQGEEKILIYEYLPNKSLDFFIFDEKRRALLDWNRRMAIIEGIAQGLLYLHKHSRLRVIHRDLKASNILLDYEMNPKISDFGLAKLCSKNDSEGSTQRIVGTYGYMAPEYASEGHFSIKSDVFSFGVLILEIVSGNRTSRFNGYGDFINLLGHSWQLWKEGRWPQLVDTSLGTDPQMLEIMRCINIALLCVQENAADRPTMSDVVAMISNKSLNLSEPKHPAYFHIRVTAEEVSIAVEPCSLNEVTVSVLDGR